MHTEHTHLPNERMIMRLTKYAELNFIVAEEYVGGGVRHLRFQSPTNLACVEREVLEVLSETSHNTFDGG